MTLKVFDLACEHEHVFEGWFASQDAYDTQRADGLIHCPVCDSAQITRRVSAPRFNLGATQPDTTVQVQATVSGSQGQAAVATPSSDQLQRLQAEVLRQVRHIVRQSEDVGARFAEEARRIHQGEAEERAIRGVASMEDCKALVEEGISLMPIPDIMDDDRLN